MSGHDALAPNDPEWSDLGHEHRARSSASCRLPQAVNRTTAPCFTVYLIDRSALTSCHHAARPKDKVNRHRILTSFG
jgi:hypothetical protein